MRTTFLEQVKIWAGLSPRPRRVVAASPSKTSNKVRDRIRAIPDRAVREGRVAFSVHGAVWEGDPNVDQALLIIEHLGEGFNIFGSHAGPYNRARRPKTKQDAIKILLDFYDAAAERTHTPNRITVSRM